MTSATRALARGAWRERWNQGWRFSRARAGLWQLAAQAGLAALLLWRIEPSPVTVPLVLPVTMAVCLCLLTAAVGGLLFGREELFGKSVLRALHVSPASGTSILIGLLLAGLPGRILSSLLMAVVAGLLLPAGGLWWTVPVLWVLALISSLTGYLAALMAILGWVRVTPRSLAVLWGMAVAVGLNVGVALLGVVTVGVPASAVAIALRDWGPWLMACLGGLAGVPALVMAIRAARRPGELGDWYREAYLSMQEFGGERHRRRTSRWPRLLPGAQGSLQARQWRELWLNWFTWVRLTFMLLCLGLLVVGREHLLFMAGRFQEAAVLGLGLAAALGSFGELPAVIGGSDGPNIGLSMVAGVRAGRVLLAKWVACLPLAAVATASTWAVSAMAGSPDLLLSLAAGCLGLVFSAIAMTGGLFDLDPHAELTERDVPQILRAALEQMPRKVGSVVGYFAGLMFTVGAAWVCLRSPDTVLLLAAGNAALAHLALAAGYWHLKRMGMG